MKMRIAIYIYLEWSFSFIVLKHINGSFDVLQKRRAHFLYQVHETWSMDIFLFLLTIYVPLCARSGKRNFSNKAKGGLLLRPLLTTEPQCSNGGAC